MMTDNPSLQNTFRNQLAQIIQLWGKTRLSKDTQQLASFKADITQWQNWAEENKLQRLCDVLDEILDSFQSDYQFNNAFIGVIDQHLNKIITATNENANHFLVKKETLSHVTLPNNQLHIAVIDDSEIARISTKAMLDRFNFDVSTYASVHDFEKDETAVSSTHLILLDVIMPDITEDELFDFASRVRQNNIQVILVSGIDDFDIRLKAVRADIGGYVTKPFDIHLLVSNIRWMCDFDVERPFQVLLLDDQTTVGEYLSAYAKDNDVELKSYSDCHTFFNDLDLGIPDLFLLDVNMPDINGMEVSKILRQQQRFEYVPIVFLSADDSLETKLAALDAGGDDVIIKDNPPHIIFKQIERRIVRGQQIRTMAVKDSLTGLLNHGQMMDAAASAFRLAQRNHSQITVAMIDIDNFKQVNDDRGHMVGDNVIVGLSQLLTTSVRESDVVGRYGGEEFLVIFHSADIDAIKLKLDQIRTTFSKLQFKDGDHTFHCTFSCGVATSTSECALRDVINRADQTMYEVKKSGKNAVKISSITVDKTN